MHRPAVPDAFDAGEEGQTLPVLRLREDEDRADLRDRFGQNRRRQHRRGVRRVRQIPLVEGDVLDADNPLVDFELDDPIHEQKRIAVGQNAFDRRVVERQRQVHARLY